MQGLIVAGLASISLTVSAAGNPAQLEWSAHYANAKRDAAANQRPLLVVVEDSSNPDGQFNVDRLASDADQIALLKNYELCRMDVNTEYGKKVAEAFKATDFPLTVITDRSANFITYRSEGTLDSQNWATTLASRSVDQPVRVETRKVVTEYPAAQYPAAQYPAAQYPATQQYPAAAQYPVYTQPAPSNCPNCVRNQQQFYYYQ